MKKWLALLVLLLFISGCKFVLEQQKGTIIKDVIIKGSEGSEHVISFSIKNLNNSAIDCYAEISSGEEITLRDIGVIQARGKEEQKTILNLKNGETKIEIIPRCKEVSDLIVQKCGDLAAYTDRRICELEIEHPKLPKCSAKTTIDGAILCLALAMNDSQICQHIRTDQKYWCMAYVTKDFSHCGNIINPNEKDWCYMNIGMNTRDESLCEKITDEAKKTSCMAVVSLDADMCLKGSQPNQVLCILNIIKVTDDKTLCEKLGDSKKKCYSSLEG